WFSCMMHTCIEYLWFPGFNMHIRRYLDYDNRPVLMSISNSILSYQSRVSGYHVINLLNDFCKRVVSTHRTCSKCGRSSEVVTHQSVGGIVYKPLCFRA